MPLVDLTAGRNWRGQVSKVEEDDRSPAFRPIVRGMYR